MLEKLELQQLKGKSLEECKTYKLQAENRKAELEALKAKGGKAWTPEAQEELDEVALFLVDIDEVIEEKAVLKAETSYKPKKGTEKMVHLQIVSGRRFNPMTGKEESAPYVQMFTFGEWQLFKKSYRSLGYAIMAVLHDPYGDAAELVQKK